MPEGPEIRRAADRVRRAVAGRPTNEVWFAFDQLDVWARELTGRVVATVEPRGKAMLTRFEGGVNVYSHNQLYGTWRVTRAGNEPRTRRSRRFVIHNDTWSAWLLSASDIVVLRDEELAAHPYLAKLGPDPLAGEADAAEVAAQAASPRFHRRRLAGTLLDQSFVAGLGNYLRSEILFEAALHPALRPKDLDDEALQRLGRATVTMLDRGYRQAGVTVPGELMRAMKADGHPKRAYRHYVFGRAGCACRTCGDTIVREMHAGRRLYRCPSCQPDAG
jgi:endonuclease-8